MKPAEARLRRALDAADPAIRLYILYGPDEAASRAFAERLGKANGPDAERIDLSSAQLKNDPALLADEAAAISLFGGRRWIRLEPLTDDALPAIEALLQAAGGRQSGGGDRGSATQGHQAVEGGAGARGT